MEAKTCAQQYDVGEYSMIGREAPLYNNKNKYYAHPLLCDRFLYLLPFRSPIERILSWMSADAAFSIKGFPEIEESMKDYVKTTSFRRAKKRDVLSAFLPYFFHTFFNVTGQEGADSVIRIMHPEQDKEQYVRIGGVATKNKWLRGYTSNAMTKWLGYEWNVDDPSSINTAQVPESLRIDIRDFNANDIHFYNALRLLLEIDYVLPFASYSDDISSKKACKYETDLENVQNGSEIIQIISDDENGIWNIFARSMNRHFNIDMGEDGKDGLFKWTKSGRPRGVTSNLESKLQEMDWKALYNMNYYDFRLYSLAKYIAEVDKEYHVRFLEK